MKFSEFFTYILAGEDTPLLKPHPDAVLKTLADLSFKAENTIVIGDMPYDCTKIISVIKCGKITHDQATRPIKTTTCQKSISEKKILLYLLNITKR